MFHSPVHHRMIGQSTKSECDVLVVNGGFRLRIFVDMSLCILKRLILFRTQQSQYDGENAASPDWVAQDLPHNTRVNALPS